MLFTADCILGLLRSATSSTVDVGSHEIGLKYCKAMSTWQSTVLEHYDLAVRKRGICHPKAQLSLKPFVVLLFVGSAVRRLRYYSEGEETASVSVLTQGPLPDLVPITYSQFALRERSLSAPDLESQQRQRLTEREVGRELRRISDEFLRTHAFRHVRPGALVSGYALRLFFLFSFLLFDFYTSFSWGLGILVVSLFVPSFTQLVFCFFPKTFRRRIFHLFIYFETTADEKDGCL